MKDSSKMKFFRKVFGFYGSFAGQSSVKLALRKMGGAGKFPIHRYKFWIIWVSFMTIFDHSCISMTSLTYSSEINSFVLSIAASKTMSNLHLNSNDKLLIFVFLFNLLCPSTVWISVSHFYHPIKFYLMISIFSLNSRLELLKQFINFISFFRVLDQNYLSPMNKKSLLNPFFILFFYLLCF